VVHQAQKATVSQIERHELSPLLRYATDSDSVGTRQ
jgi:hypothetical protein